MNAGCLVCLPLQIPIDLPRSDTYDALLDPRPLISEYRDIKRKKTGDFDALLGRRPAGTVRPLRDPDSE